MKIEQFLNNATHLNGLFVSPDGRWSTEPARGFKFKTRAEILGGPAEEKPAEPAAQPEQSSENGPAEPKVSAQKQTKPKKK